MPIINKKKGIVFWITGISGSGKTTISNKIHKFIEKKYGPTLVVSGDDLREIFNLTGYSKKKRYSIAKQYSMFCKFISNQKINLIFSTGSLFHEIHKLNRKVLSKYIEIFINAEIKTLKKKRKKFFYKKQTKNVWGIDIIPELPKKPDIILDNDYKLNVKEISNKLILKIKMLNK